MRDTDSLSYYEILQVSRDAPAESIRGSYRRLMQHGGIHPDLGGDTATAALVNKAWSVLSDAARRRAYDVQLDARMQAEAGRACAVQSPRRQLDPARECVFCEQPHPYGAAVDPDALCDNCVSPLCAAENLRMEPAGQRAVARVQKEMDVAFYLDWRQARGFAGRTEDISLNGLRLVTRRPVRTEQRIKLVSSVLEAVGHVTHCAVRRRGWKREHVAGVSFLTLRFMRSVGGFVSHRA